LNLRELRNARREHVEPHIRALLARDGCPACIETAHGETNYFVWLLIETYGFPEWLAEFSAGFGFCQRHGDQLLRHETAGDQISYFHGYAASRILQQLVGASSGKPLAMGPCPACRSMAEISSRTLLFLRKLLLSADECARYDHPGLLCFLHLRMLLPHMPWTRVVELLRQHETAVRDAAESLGSAATATENTARIPTELITVLHLLVGHAPQRLLWPTPLCQARRRARDPVNDCAALLANSDACPVCLEIGQAWYEWFVWLEEAAHDPAIKIDDLLPTCREHTWALVRHATPPLRAAIANHLVDRVLGRIGSANHALVRRPGKRRFGWQNLREHLDGDRRRVNSARNIAVLDNPCPLCNELDTVRDRVITLLFALLRQNDHRARFESGYGLCLKHFYRALALAPDRATTDTLLNSEVAKLSLLRWELDESLRKRSWSVRPEVAGAEHDAWQRAIARFSGSFRQPETRH
jgi:hypothetical protein